MVMTEDNLMKYKQCMLCLVANLVNYSKSRREENAQERGVLKKTLSSKSRISDYMKTKLKPKKKYSENMFSKKRQPKSTSKCWLCVLGSISKCENKCESDQLTSESEDPKSESCRILPGCSGKTSSATLGSAEQEDFAQEEQNIEWKESTSLVIPEQEASTEVLFLPRKVHHEDFFHVDDRITYNNTETMYENQNNNGFLKEYNIQETEESSQYPISTINVGEERELGERLRSLECEVRQLEGRMSTVRRATVAQPKGSQLGVTASLSDHSQLEYSSSLPDRSQPVRRLYVRKEVPTIGERDRTGRTLFARLYLSQLKHLDQQVSSEIASLRRSKAEVELLWATASTPCLVSP